MFKVNKIGEVKFITWFSGVVDYKKIKIISCIYPISKSILTKGVKYCPRKLKTKSVQNTLIFLYRVWLNVSDVFIC